MPIDPRADSAAQLHIEELDPFAGSAAGRHHLQVLIRQLLDGTYLSMPALVISDGRERPRMVLVAGQHGNEWNGPWILHLLARRIKPEKVQGTLVILPLANPLAFNERRRVSSIDSVDLNRVYLGGTPRKPTEHLALLLWRSVFSRADYVIDLHSAGPGEYLPFAGAPGGSCLDLARSLNLEYIHTPGVTDGGFLVDYCLRAGIRSILIEVGGGRSLDHQYHDAVIEGLMNLMRSVGILPGEIVAGVEPYIFEHKELVPSPCAGFFCPEIALGDMVQDGDRLGVVSALLGAEETEIRAPRSGKVIYLRREPAVSEKESLVHLV